MRFEGRAIRLESLPRLTAWRGKLLSGEPKGEAVHAGSFLPKRRIILDRGLFAHSNNATRILLHEMFHFAWVRLSNAQRLSWELLLRDEGGARGELGWSSEWRRRELAREDAESRSKRWREYACESFCDSAAWRFGALRSHVEFTLAARWRERRAAWLDAQFAGRAVKV